MKCISAVCALFVFRIKVVATGEAHGMCRVGWSVISGMLVFLFLEKILEISNPETREDKKKEDNK